MNVLVTGGCGFIGSNFINIIFDRTDFIIHNIDKLTYCSNYNNVEQRIIQSSRYHYYQNDINDYECLNKIFKHYDIQLIVHFAASSHVDNSFTDPDDFIFNNVNGTLTLLKCATNLKNLYKFIHISTDEVYGESQIECSEDAPLNPTNPYSASKASAEMFVKSFFYSFKIPAIILRGNNLYGKNQYPEKLISKFISQIKSNKKMTIHGVGDNKRNFINVYDFCNGIIKIIENGIIGETYNIGSSNEFSILEIASLLLNTIKPNEKLENYIEFVKNRPFNDSRYLIDCKKLIKLGWKEEINFYDGINSII